jgi:hypothetical protein
MWKTGVYLNRAIMILKLQLTIAYGENPLGYCMTR